jgi:acetyl esterase/lipase
MKYPEIIAIPNNPALTGLAEVLPDIVYASPAGQPLTLQLLRPWGENDAPRKLLPLILFIQGSGWTSPNVYYELPQLARYAQNGYVVATITHRNAMDGHPFPAFLQDSKAALRFLRAHAAEYGIDASRVCVFGTSSGGNTALLMGLTGDDPRYKTADYADQSDAVTCVIDCFGPTDLRIVADHLQEAAVDWPVFLSLIDNQDAHKVMHAMSPLLHVQKGVAYPPFLLIHGDEDTIVAYKDSVSMYHALCDAGVWARLIRVIGAPHEGNFWSPRLHGLIAEYLGEKL